MVKYHTLRLSFCYLALLIDLKPSCVDSEKVNRLNMATIKILYFLWGESMNSMKESETLALSSFQR